MPVLINFTVIFSRQTEIDPMTVKFLSYRCIFATSGDDLRSRLVVHLLTSHLTGSVTIFHDYYADVLASVSRAHIVDLRK